MNDRLKIYKTLPDIIKNVLILFEGWLVGGSIKDLLEDKSPKDYDIIVPSRELYQLTCMNFTHRDDYNVCFNTFGGLKYEGKYEIDFWPEELDHFLKTAAKQSYCYNLKRNILLKVEAL